MRFFCFANNKYIQPTTMRIAVEGNIGAGKTSALEILEKNYDIDVRYEPTNDLTFQTLLKEYYENPRSRAFALQSFLSCYHSKTKDAPDRGITVTERSPTSSRMVFGEIIKNAGYMTPKEWHVYTTVDQTLGWTPDRIIYIHTSAHTCIDRIERRARAGEKGGGVDVLYLRQIEYQYEKLLKSFKKEHVCYIDGLLPSEEIAAKMFDAITAFSP